MQGTQVWSLVWEDSTCCRATKPTRGNYRARTPQQENLCVAPEDPTRFREESTRPNYRARTPQRENLCVAPEFPTRFREEPCAAAETQRSQPNKHIRKSIFFFPPLFSKIYHLFMFMTITKVLRRIHTQMWHGTFSQQAYHQAVQGEKTMISRQNEMSTIKKVQRLMEMMRQELTESRQGFLKRRQWSSHEQVSSHVTGH